MTDIELFDKLKDLYTDKDSLAEWRERVKVAAPLVNRINKLKKEKNAVILSHTYVEPEIIYTVADHVGDSYGLSKNAVESDAQTIVFSAVDFMGETAKILNPEKTVLVPATDGGCTLADSITGEQVRELKKKYPDYLFICYINTTADVKAACDVCVTSSNVYDIVETVSEKKIYFVPDRLMGANIVNEMKKRGVDKEILYFNGSCYVHEEFEPELIPGYRKKYPGLYVMAHPECTPELLSQVDFVGSTTQLYDEVARSEAPHYLVFTERGLLARIRQEMSGKKHLCGPCQSCKYMKTNSLEEIVRVLTDPAPEQVIELDESLRKEAERCIKRMFEIVEGGL